MEKAIAGEPVYSHLAASSHYFRWEWASWSWKSTYKQILKIYITLWEMELFYWGHTRIDRPKRKGIRNKETEKNWRFKTLNIARVSYFIFVKYNQCSYAIHNKYFGCKAREHTLLLTMSKLVRIIEPVSTLVYKFGWSRSYKKIILTPRHRCFSVITAHRYALQLFKNIHRRDRGFGYTIARTRQLFYCRTKFEHYHRSNYLWNNVFCFCIYTQSMNFRIANLSFFYLPCG